MKTLAVAASFAAIFFSMNAHAQAQDASVLKAFEEIVRECESSFQSRVSVFHQQRLSRWLKREIANPAITFDVKRSDSLVSPFVATLTARYQVLAGGAPTKEEAELLKLDESGGVEARAEVLNYAYQSGAWKAISARSESRYRSSSGASIPTPTALQYTREQAMDPTGLQGPIRHCLR